MARPIGWSFVAPPDPTDRGDWASLNEYQNLEKNADQAWQDYVAASQNKEMEQAQRVLDGKGEATQEQFEAAKAATQQALEAANRAIEERNLWLPKVAAEQGNDGVLPTEDPDTAVARSVEGWRIPASPQASPSPTAPPEDGTAHRALCSSINCTRATPRSCSSIQTTAVPCGAIHVDDNGTVDVTPDADSLEAVMIEVCWSRIQPAGPDEDPCAPPVSTAQSFAPARSNRARTPPP